MKIGIGVLMVVVACGNNTSKDASRREGVKEVHMDNAASTKNRDDFLAWVKSSLHQAERALHNGDPGPRRALWSRREPVTVFGALLNAHGQQQIDALFAGLGTRFSNCESHAYDLQAYDVVGDMAYTVGMERTTFSFDNKPRRLFTKRVTQVYRREDNQWRVVHRHADLVTPDDGS